MITVVAVLLCLVAYFFGFKVYSKFLSKSIFQLSEREASTPAHKWNDGIDYVPTKPSILFGHHFASIAGLAPILGPAVAVIWGWLPAMLWVVFGGIFIGCVHDFGALVVSLRNDGKSIGQVAEDILGPRARSLFHAIIFFLVSLAMGVFVLVIAGMYSAPVINPATSTTAIVKEKVETTKDALEKENSSKPITLKEIEKNHDKGELQSKSPTSASSPAPTASSPIQLRSQFPEAVIPSVALMIFALITGYLHYVKKQNITVLTGISFVLTILVTIVSMNPQVLEFTGLNDPSRSPSVDSWKWILLAYAFIASVTPVWLLLQSRDYINSFLLYLGIGLIYIGYFVGGIQNHFPSFNAEAFRSDAVGLDILPFVFITIACGAVSGFHSLVSSGTTAKQIDKETDARVIGYGGMLGESLLGLTAVIACTAGFANAGEWNSFYKSWAGIQGLAPQVGAYIYGTSRFLGELGIPNAFSQGFIALVVVSFALTSLDSATRLLRYNIEEIVDSTKVDFLKKILGNRYVSSLIACASIAVFAFLKIEQDGKMKPAGLALWKLFGTTNQLLAGLALLVITLYLFFNKRKAIYTFVPMVFVLFVTIWAMITNFLDFFTSKNPSYFLGGIGGILLVLAIWLVIEGILAAWKKRDIRKS